MELDSERDETPLQGKLTVLAEDIGKAGTAVAAVCFVGQIIIWLLNNARELHASWLPNILVWEILCGVALHARRCGTRSC